MMPETATPKGWQFAVLFVTLTAPLIAGVILMGVQAWRERRARRLPRP